MERHGIGMISLRYRAEDFLNLNLSVNEGDWDTAIQIVYDRFHERYFSTIHYLSYDFKEKRENRKNSISVDKVEKNGFAIMALNCLLIDTFYQFEYGLKSSNDFNPITRSDKVGPNYKQFLRQKLPGIFMAEGPSTTGDDFAELFYKDIRCGILHSAQTKNYSMLACEGGPAVSYIYPGDGHVGVRVEVSALSKALEYYFRNDYMNRLKNGDEVTREAFIKKMNSICSNN